MMSTQNLNTAQTDDHGLDNWRELHIDQQPTWSEHEDFASTIAELNSVPPLVFAGEVDAMRQALGEVAEGRAFLLQGGDCAETFAGATADKISGRVKTILQMSAVLTYGASMPVVKMGRMAGQFSKPRSADMETRGDVTLPSFRGELAHLLPADSARRRHRVGLIGLVQADVAQIDVDVAERDRGVALPLGGDRQARGVHAQTVQ